MGFWSIVTWVIVGGLAGWVASMIVGTSKNQGVVGNIVSGIIGALVGGFIFELLGGSGFTGFNPWSFLVALVGAIIVLLIWKAIRGNKKAA